MLRCETCTSTFATRQARNQHMDDKEHRNYKCNNCHKVFRSKSAAAQHMKEVGHGTPKFSCQTCLDRFQTQPAADQHMWAKDHYKYCCKPCGKHFSIENDLKGHLKSNIHHTNVSSPIKQTTHTTACGVGTHIKSESRPQAPQLNHATILPIPHERDTRDVNTQKALFDPREYSIGWICALPIEMAAALGMLDETYRAPSQHKQDENNYGVGRIAQHKIVIACLPVGLTGVTSAARVVEQMRLTFTDLRFGLMVGIGGGVPSEHSDVRLGDVVVSKPSDTFGGVIQYDFGKTIQNGHFLRTGSLNQPPTVLLNAVSKLIAEDHLVSSRLASRISSHLADMQAKLSHDLKSQWLYQGAENDQLFKSNYDHESDSDTCVGCDSKQLEARLARGSNQPKVHYGLIASGNQVMRDGTTRERLRQETNVLCFEMEAAGLMNSFPCLVIRGICDYADSHKNKQWQPYAAATAAAYAKGLLQIVPVHKYC